IRAAPCPRRCGQFRRFLPAEAVHLPFRAAAYAQSKSHAARYPRRADRYAAWRYQLARQSGIHRVATVANCCCSGRELRHGLRAGCDSRLVSSAKTGLSSMAQINKAAKYKDILFEVIDQVGWVTINRQNTLNASRELPLNEIASAVRSTRDDPSIACLVI